MFLGVKEYLGIVLLKQSCFKIAKLDSEVVSAYSVVELKNVTSDYHVLFMFHGSKTSIDLGLFPELLSSCLSRCQTFSASIPPWSPAHGRSPWSFWIICNSRVGSNRPLEHTLQLWKGGWGCAGYVPMICWSFLRLEGWLFLLYWMLLFLFLGRWGFIKKKRNRKTMTSSYLEVCWRANIEPENGSTIGFLRDLFEVYTTFSGHIQQCSAYLRQGHGTYRRSKGEEYGFGLIHGPYELLF